ncbi:sulfur carrier protein [Salsuginibacillus halophilus]|uniref:Sulfur carrier protein n=1 Tax=Salsuginibacillus halophilus TaxID=517424 RepID=A0A2P8H7Y3_9BACI|nr:sulfur carrier protein ThiS [Salsuginibacillus halophilus]PSL42332.1 sulfur carrier protein [Salsuginibacillus halophilus]
MELYINGQLETLENVETLYDVVAHYGLTDRMVATEVNGTIVEREKWETTKLEDETAIELVHFVGGG